VSLLFWIVFLVGERGYDADWFREALQGKDIKPCIPGRISRRLRTHNQKMTVAARQMAEKKTVGHLS